MRQAALIAVVLLSSASLSSALSSAWLAGVVAGQGSILGALARAPEETGEGRVGKRVALAARAVKALLGRRPELVRAYLDYANGTCHSRARL